MSVCGFPSHESDLFLLPAAETERQGHAFDYVKELSLGDFDAIVTVSGDGLIHEVLNGLAHHADPLTALDIPLAPIPAGSGNGLSLNLIGIEHGFDSASAALNVVKGTGSSAPITRQLTLEPRPPNEDGFVLAHARREAQSLFHVAISGIDGRPRPRHRAPEMDGRHTILLRHAQGK